MGEQLGVPLGTQSVQPGMRRQLSQQLQLAAQHPVLPPSLYRLYCHSVPQVLDVGGQDCEPDISGIDFSPSGRRLYVGTEGSITGG